mgnify:CR=1 FL=1
MGHHNEPDGEAIPQTEAARFGGHGVEGDGWPLPAGGHHAPIERSGPLTRSERLAAYRALLLIRRFEEKAGQLYAFGDIGGYCHLSIGQEAVAVALALAAAAGDQMVTGHRCHGHMLARGGEPRAVMAELAGRAGGVSRGKGGSMHLYAPEAGFFGGQGIVGAAAPIAAGLAFANRYRGDGKVAWCCIGDRALDQGQVSEALDMAARWRLPLVIVVENNAPEAASDAHRRLWRRGEPFGIAGESVDGVSVEAVREAALRAAEHARSGLGPRIVETRTEDFRGHAQASAPALTPAEMQARREREDPVERARADLIAAGVATREELRDMDDEIRDVIGDAADAALAVAEPDAAALLTDVVTHG